MDKVVTNCLNPYREQDQALLCTEDENRTTLPSGGNEETLRSGGNETTLPSGVNTLRQQLDGEGRIDALPPTSHLLADRGMYNEDGSQMCERR